MRPSWALLARTSRPSASRPTSSAGRPRPFRETTDILRRKTASLREMTGVLRRKTASVRETTDVLRRKSASLREMTGVLRRKTGLLRRGPRSVPEGPRPPRRDLK